MNFLQEVVDCGVSSLVRYLKPFYLLVFTLITSMVGAVLLPYRAAMLVDDAQIRLTIVANILELPFPKEVVGVAAIVLLFYFNHK
jgi:hypothetical protein